MWRAILVAVALIANGLYAEIDYAVDCEPGYRVTAIRRTKSYYNVLGSITIECEQIARPETVSCAKQPSIPRCNGQMEVLEIVPWGLTSIQYNVSTALTFVFRLDPVCCTSPSVRIDSKSCINDQINTAVNDFSHSVVSDLTYRGLQCWHQYNTNRTLVDLLWKMEICPFQSIDVPVVTVEQNCEECKCSCGIEQCASGAEPVRVIHKKRLGKCGCDCRCTYRCVTF